MLDPARNELGRIATAMTFSFNELQRSGMDLNGVDCTSGSAFESSHSLLISKVGS